jgi:hypothetical protein
VQQVLGQPQLLVAPHERRLWCVAAAAAAPDLADDPDRPPRRHWLRLALDRDRVEPLERDGARRRAVGAVADEDRPGLGRRLQPRGGVDDVARHHPLPDRTHLGRRLAGHDPAARLERDVEVVAESGDLVDHLEGRAHGALGVVLVRGGRAPHGHDRVADELLDHAAVALHRLCRGLEVPVEDGTHVLGVAALGERGEPDEVDEHDRHQPPLGDRGRPVGGLLLATGRGGLADQPLAALTAVLAVGRVGGAAARAGQSEAGAALLAELPPVPR